MFPLKSFLHCHFIIIATTSLPFTLTNAITSHLHNKFCWKDHFISSSNHTSHSFKCLFFFHYIRQIIHPHFNGRPQSMLPYFTCYKTHLCSSTDARLGYHFKLSTFIVVLTCSSPASVLRWNSFKRPQNHLTTINTMSTRKSFVAGSWLAEITTYQTSQQCLLVCLISMYLS